MATKFFGMINKEIKNISGYLSNGNKKQQSRSLDDQHNEILSSNVFNHNNLTNDNDFNLNKQRYPKCSTSSSIDSGNSTSSSESNNQLNTKQPNNLVIGQSTFHNTSLSSSQLSSGYSTLKSKTELDQQEEQQQINENNKDIDLGNTERAYAEPTDFEYLKVIGQGSYGKVFLARHKKEQKVYAVKVLQKKMILTKNEQHHIMCERNVLLKNLNHPFLVGLHYSFQTRDKLYFVLEFVSGGELFFHLQQENCFTEPRARFYAAEITSALGYLHKRNIIYRDLKPENILLDKDGHIVLTDFGLCKDNLKFDETTTTLCGSLDYLSPEIVKKERYGWSVDWWCLGSVIYEMLYGLPPFYSRDQKEMFYNILNKPVKVRTNISISARDIITGLLNKNKDLRLGSKNDVDEIKSHDFFREINWSDLESKKIEPPFNPNVKNNMDLRNISTEFTNEPVSNSLYRSSIGPSSIPEHAFKGFSYAPNVYN